MKKTKVQEYISISSKAPLWGKLSTELKGRCYRVAESWRETGIIKQEDWILLVKHNYVGKRIYVQKSKKVYYKDILCKNRDALSGKNEM